MTLMSSPFTSKLGTNYCPQDEEIDEIQALLVEPTHRLWHLDEEISDLQRVLDKLTAERDRLNAYMDAHRALLSPIRRVPLDIMQEIFLACIPTHRNCVMSAKEAPVLLGRICSAWRAISLATPRLWSKIHIAVPHEESGTKLSLCLDTAKTWLDRSGECPLSISTHGTHNYPVSYTMASLLPPILLPLAFRWEHISLTLPTSVLASLSHLTAADVPILKSVVIKELNEPSSSVQVDWLDFLRAPEMSSISFAPIAFSALDLPLRWDNMTVISLAVGGNLGHPFTSDVALQLLSRCTALQICQLGIDGQPDAGSGGPVIECPFLRTFDLWVSGFLSVTFPHLFGRLSCPALRHLAIDGYTSDNDDLSRAPSVFICAPNVTSLDITLQLFSKPSLTDFLLGLPSSIQKLKITEVPFSGFEFLDENLLAALIPSPDQHIPSFSGLQDLEINGCHLFSDEALLQFIESGISSRTLGALKRLAIRFSRPMQVDICPDLQPFIEKGLHIDFAYRSPSVWKLSPWQGLDDDPNAVVPNYY
ncbi:hypothetical protein FB451DRAFT_1239102, partial [Mycena latifolia]